MRRWSAVVVFGAVLSCSASACFLGADDLVEPVYVEGKDAGKSTIPHLEGNAGRVADALLAITDGKAQRSKSGVVKATYDRLRPTAKKNVEQAIPRLARLVEKYAG